MIGAVEGRAREQVRSHLRHHRPRARRRAAPPARLLRQPLDHRLALSHRAQPADRRDLCRGPARHARRFPLARAASSWTRPTTPRPPAARATRSPASSPGRCDDLARALRAPPVPHRDAAQRPFQQLLRAARNARPAALHARRRGAPARSRAGDGPAAQDRPAPPRRGVPGAEGRAHSARRPARGRARARSLAAARGLWRAAQCAASPGCRGHKAALAKLAFVGLQQRLLSSIAAFLRR